jgi:hypothetical protein
LGPPVRGDIVQNLVLIMTEDDERMTPSLAALIKADFHV